jgi:hypothetical protein
MRVRTVIHGRLARVLVTVSLLLLLECGAALGLHDAARAQIAESPTTTGTRSAQHRLSHTVSHAVSSVRIFLVAIDDGGKSGKMIGCGDSLVAVSRSIAPTNTPLSAAFRLLLRDHRRTYGQSGLYNALYQSRLRLQRASVVNGRATVYLVGTMQLGGVCDDPRVGAQLRHTALQFPTVHSVRIYINGIPLAKRLSEKG